MAEPVGGRADEADLLQACCRRCLQLAELHELTSLAFPAIGTGVYCYPPEQAAGIAVHTVRQHRGPALALVRFVCFDAATLAIYRGPLDT